EPVRFPQDKIVRSLTHRSSTCLHEEASQLLFCLATKLHIAPPENALRSRHSSCRQCVKDCRDILFRGIAKIAKWRVFSWIVVSNVIKHCQPCVRALPSSLGEVDRAQTRGIISFHSPMVLHQKRQS